MSQVLPGYTSWGLTGTGGSFQGHHPAGVSRHAQAWASLAALGFVSLSLESLRGHLILPLALSKRPHVRAQPALPCFLQLFSLF